MTASNPSPMPPNILLLILDCLRYDGLGCNGNPRPLTPHIDAWAAHSRRYTQARAAAIWTLPSHASLFTGLHPRQHGVNVEQRLLEADMPTLAEILTQLGYQTAAFSTNAWVGPHFGLERGFEHFAALWRIFPGMGQRPFPWWEKALRKRVLERSDKGAAKLNRSVRRWWRRQRHAERPFFMFGLYLDAHLPYRPPHTVAARLLDARALAAANSANQDAWAYMAGEATMTPADFDGLRALYDAEINYVDAQVGQLLGFLQDVGALDNTIVIITADHGENIGHHGLMDHQYCVYDSLAHVPLLIHHSQLFPAGDDPTPVQHTDLFPTLLHAAAAPELLSLPGRSLLASAPPSPPAIIQYTASHRHRFARRHPHFDMASKGYDRTFDAIVQDGYKLIRSSRGELEMYHLPTDPGETTNLAPNQPLRLTELTEALDAWLAAHPPHTPGASSHIDPDLAEHLRNLGYL